MLGYLCTAKKMLIGNLASNVFIPLWLIKFKFYNANEKRWKLFFTKLIQL